MYGTLQNLTAASMHACMYSVNVRSLYYSNVARAIKLIHISHDKHNRVAPHSFLFYTWELVVTRVHGLRVDMVFARAHTCLLTCV